MDLFVALPVAVIIIIAVTALAPKAGVAAPLILVLVGILISFLPGFPGIDVEPELVLAGMLPPLLYSTAVALPVMDFRRDFAAIGLLSVLLVLISAVVLGFVFRALIPDLGLAGGIALGAIVSPTDAVATSIVKGLGAPSRVITVLEGEGLINDATSMVLLRTAIAAAVATVSLGAFARTFAWAVVGAVICGFAAGTIGLLVRHRLVNPALTTAVSFVVPFAAFLLAEEIGASGLVAAVVAGLVTSYGSAKFLTPQDRFFDHANWRTVERLVEGLLFLMMGLQLAPTIREVLESHDNLRLAIFVAILAMILVPLIRSCFVAPMLWHLHKVAMRVASRRDQMEWFQGEVDARIANAGDDGIVTFGPRGPSGRTREVHVSRAHDFRTRIVRRISDADYMISKPLGPREGVLLVWAGMRGVVTLAAAKSLPRLFPHRPLVVLIAFFVAAGSLLIQGGTLPHVVRRLGLANQHDDDPASARELREVMEISALDLLTSPDLRRPNGSRYDETVVRRVLSEMDSVTSQLDSAENPQAIDQAEQYNELRVRTLNRQRAALLEVRSHGTQDSEQLATVLDAIDVQQIALEIHDV